MTAIDAPARIAQLEREVERLTPYVEAFRREERRADQFVEECDHLRELGKRAAEFIRTCDPFGDRFSEHDLRVLAGEPVGPLPEFCPRGPMPDEETGIVWWNSLDDKAREHWMREAGDTGRAVDAWHTYLIQQER